MSNPPNEQQSLTDHSRLFNILALVTGILGILIILWSCGHNSSIPEKKRTHVSIQKEDNIDHLINRLEELLVADDFDATMQKFTAEAEAWAERLSTQAKSEKEFQELREAINRSHSLLLEKQNTLTNIQKQLALVSLDTNQLSLVQTYNQSLKHDVSFKEWFMKPLTWYEFGKSLVISSAFFSLGRITNRKKRQKISTKRSKPLPNIFTS